MDSKYIKFDGQDIDRLLMEIEGENMQANSPQHRRAITQVSSVKKQLSRKSSTRTITKSADSAKLSRKKTQAISGLRVRSISARDNQDAKSNRYINRLKQYILENFKLKSEKSKNSVSIRIIKSNPIDDEELEPFSPSKSSRIKSRRSVEKKDVKIDLKSVPHWLEPIAVQPKKKNPKDSRSLYLNFQPGLDSFGSSKRRVKSLNTLQDQQGDVSDSYFWSTTGRIAKNHSLSARDKYSTAVYEPTHNGSSTSARGLGFMEVNSPRFANSASLTSLKNGFNTMSSISDVESSLSSMSVSASSGLNLSTGSRTSWISSLLKPSSKISKSSPSVMETQRIKSPSSVDALNSHLKHFTERFNLSPIEGMVNQYALLRIIGDGKFSKVWLGFDIYAEKYFACKCISKKRLKKMSMWRLGPKGKPNQLRSPESSSGFLEMIQNEITMLKDLKHDNVSKLVEVMNDPDHDNLIMVFDLCEYGPIMKLKIGEMVRPFNETLCKHYFKDIVNGLKYLHSKGIIHRDIKPDNILITAGNRCIISDFSISCYILQDNRKIMGNVPTFDPHERVSTGENGIMTPAFTPPELLSSTEPNTLSFANDIWSLGVTLYCLSHGSLPFMAEDVGSIYQKILGQDIENLISNSLSKKMRSMLLCLMDRNPLTRISTSVIPTHQWWK